MPKPLVCLAARSVLRDRDTDTISLFSILESLRAEGLPVFIQEVGVLVMWKREEDEPSVHELKFRILNNSRVLHELPVRVDFREGRTNRTIVNLRGMPIEEPGEVRFAFFDGESEIASYRVAIEAPEPRVTSVGDDDAPKAV